MASKDIETIPKPPKNLCPGPDGFTAEFNQTFKENFIPILLTFFQKIEKKEYFLTHFTSLLLPWYQKRQGQHTHKKKL